MTRPWRLLIHEALPGYTQMAIDESLFQLANAESAPVLRFYTWERPTLSLGFFQDQKAVVSESFLVHNNIDVVRRITGGRTVLHHKEVTYAIASHLHGPFENQSLGGTYRLIAQALQQGLHSFGIEPSFYGEDSPVSVKENRLPQCFVAVSRYELSRGTRKIIGSAQKRSRDRFIQHGSILLDFDLRLQNGAVLDPDPAIETKIAPLNQLLGRELGLQEVVEHFKHAFMQEFAIEFELSDLTKQEKELVDSLEPVYQSSEWTKHGCR